MVIFDMRRGGAVWLAVALVLAGAGLVGLASTPLSATGRTGARLEVSPAPVTTRVVRTAQATMPGKGLGQDWEWQGAHYESFTAFIEALQAERYTTLLFKRISDDLRRGKVIAMARLLERYHTGRWRRNLPGEASTFRRQMLRATADDTREALGFANKSTDLDIPEFMIEPIVGLAQRIVHKLYRLSGPAPGDVADVAVPEEEASEESSEPGGRAENTGLYHDVVDFVSQEHLQFLFRGDVVTVKARLLAELLKVARSDNLVVDEKSVSTFVDRLVEAGVVEPTDKARLTRRAMHAFATKADVAAGAPESPSQPAQTEAEAPVPAPAPPVEAPDTTPSEPETPVAPPEPRQPDPVPVPDSEAIVPEGEAVPEVTRPVTVTPPPPRTPNAEIPGAPGQVVPQMAKSDFLVVAEAGMGVTIPAHDGDLGPGGQSVQFDPGIAARFALGALWLDVLGPAHLGVSLVAVVGRTETDRLQGVAVPGGSATGGSNSYIGLMPFVSIEWPVATGINIRIGGGLGVAYQNLEVLAGTAKIIDADGTSFMAQVGGGLRFALSTCMDLGLDVFATHLDAVKGSGIGGAPVTFAGAWDIAAYASVRVAFGAAAHNSGCQVFAP